MIFIFVSLELSDTEIFRSLEINIMPSLLAFTSIGTLSDLYPGFSRFLSAGIPLPCGVTIPLRLDLSYLPVFPNHSSRTLEDMWGSNFDAFFFFEISDYHCLILTLQKEIFKFVVLLGKFQTSEPNCFHVLQTPKIFIGMTLYLFIWGK